MDSTNEYDLAAIGEQRTTAIPANELQRLARNSTEMTACIPIPPSPARRPATIPPPPPPEALTRRPTAKMATVATPANWPAPLFNTGEVRSFRYVPATAEPIARLVKLGQYATVDPDITDATYPVATGGEPVDWRYWLLPGPRAARNGWVQVSDLNATLGNAGAYRPNEVEALYLMGLAKNIGSCPLVALLRGADHMFVASGKPGRRSLARHTVPHKLAPNCIIIGVFGEEV